jgi:CRP-like cAMP-binding protein
MNGLHASTDGLLRNALLAALPRDARDRLAHALEPVFLPQGQALYEPGALLHCVYFPTSAVVSLLYLLVDGAADEIAVVGAEGLVGVSLVLGGERAPSRAVVLCAGSAYRLARRHLDDELARGGALQELLLRYVQALSMQVAQLAVCNRHHSVEQHLCRWLLSILDRQSSDQLQITHEMIADRMGVRREGVTEAAGKLLRAGVIRLDRRRITVVDRRALEARACECYGVIRCEAARLAAPDTAVRAVVALTPDHGRQRTAPDGARYHNDAGRPPGRSAARRPAVMTPRPLQRENADA